MRKLIYVVLMVVLAGCTPPGPLSEGERTSQDSPAAARHPLSEGDGPAHTTSPRPSPGGEGVASRALEKIDSLMWVEADSALKVMMEFAGSEAADGMDAFEGHYCQVLVAELLFKNYYGQSNRAEVLKAVHYFDSIVGMDGADARGVSVQGRNAFLAARAHYINGAGLYERDSVVAACSEYLKALEIMETQDFAALRDRHVPRFMGLTYSRLTELFSGQFMQEPAIVFCKKALALDKIEPGSPLSQSNLLKFLGKQYDKLNQYDSALYYYDKALRILPDTNNVVFRDLVSQIAFLDFYMSKCAEPSICDLKRMAGQAIDEKEKLKRYFTIGSIYYETEQYDSAWVYLLQVFEKEDDAMMQRTAAFCLRDICQNRGDSLKAARYAVFQAENAVPDGVINALVSQLNELFQQHLQWEQEKTEVERRQAEQLAARRRLVRGVVTAVVVLLVLGLGLWWWMAKRRKEHEAETQTLNEEKQQLQTQVDDALQQLQTVDDALQQLQTQADDALQLARAMLPQRETAHLQLKAAHLQEKPTRTKTKDMVYCNFAASLTIEQK